MHHPVVEILYYVEIPMRSGFCDRDQKAVSFSCKIVYRVICLLYDWTAKIVKVSVASGPRVAELFGTWGIRSVFRGDSCLVLGPM